MRTLWASILATIIGLSVLPGLLVAEEIRSERVHFKAAASSATLKGSVKGYESVDYVLGAKAGQTMTVSLKTGHTANYFNVLAPGSETAIGRGDTTGNDWTGTLPVDGDYRVRVYLMRSAARREETADYALTVSITGGPEAAAGRAGSADAKVPGTPFHATGTVPCSVGPDPKGSLQCSFGVIRHGGGNAEVHLAPFGFDITVHKVEVDAVLIFKGDSVTIRDPKDRLTAEKQGDAWSISVNDFLFYTIPEAVITGG